MGAGVCAGATAGVCGGSRRLRRSCMISPSLRGSPRAPRFTACRTSATEARIFATLELPPGMGMGISDASCKPVFMPPTASMELNLKIHSLGRSTKSFKPSDPPFFNAENVMAPGMSNALLLPAAFASFNTFLPLVRTSCSARFASRPTNPAAPSIPGDIKTGEV